jgi:hypothetical protein
VTGPFANAIIILSLVLAVAAFVLAIANRTRPIAILVGAVILEVMLLAFLVGGIVQMIGSDQDFARAEFVGYLLACAAVVPAAVWWAWGEPTRASMVVVGVAFLIMPILVVRTQQVWAGPVA